ncbi:MAG: alpha/beta hydrolase [Saprospiraceae bacterium]
MEELNLQWLNRISAIMYNFCEEYLSERYYQVAEFIVELINAENQLTVENAEPEVWASAVIQLLLLDGAGLDRQNNFEVSPDMIHEFFATSKEKTDQLLPQIISLFTEQNQEKLRRFLLQEQQKPEAMAFRSGSDDSRVEQGPDFIKFQVLYGTNRKLNSNDENIRFGIGRDNKLHLGFCDVSIPKSHELGHLERPDWFSELILGESANKHFMVLSNNALNREEFVRMLRQKVGASDENDSLLFIHGYNVDFDEAIMRAAQLGYDLNFKGGVSAFSWPSLGSLSGYVTDYDSAKLSSKYLVEFLKILVNDSTRKLHIIAHSMGNVALTESLIQLKEEGFLPNTIIQQIILAAPDLDKDIFVNQIMPTINGIARLTMYASNKDKALFISRKIRNDYNRLGEGGENLVLVDGMESIDASKVDTTLLGHGYFADTKSLLNDIHMVLRGTPPDDRSLDLKNKLVGNTEKPFWTFR